MMKVFDFEVGIPGRAPIVGSRLIGRWYIGQPAIDPKRDHERLDMLMHRVTGDRSGRGVI